MKFRVTIRKKDAPDSTRIIEQPSRFAVYDQIGKEGGRVIDIQETKDYFAIPDWITDRFSRKIKHAVITQMAKNLSTMLAAGLSLSRALLVIERQSSNAHFKKIITRLSDVIGKGSPLHAALAEYPKIFPSIFIMMIKVGEESGSLVDALNVVALQMEHSEGLTRKIKGAMIYPSIIVIAIIIVSILMLIYVVPTLTKTFTDLKVALPFATQIFVWISDFMANNILFVLTATAALIAGGITFTHSARGSSLLLRGGMYMPVVGELIRETFAARTARTLSSLLQAGVPVLEALSITEDVVHAPVFADVVHEAEAYVKKGEPLSKAFIAHTKIYPILMNEMLLVGEETGKVALMLKQIAELYETDVSEKTKDLSTIIEPILMLLIGSVVGIFAVAMIAPIYSLSSAI